MSDTTAKELGHIPRLIGSKNFVQWKTLLQRYFEREDVWLVVTGQQKKPAEMLPMDPDEEDRISEEALTVYQRKLKRWTSWKTKDSKAIFAIQVTVHSDYVRSLATFTSAKEMWNEILSQFEAEGPIQQSIYFSIWTNLIYDPSSNIEIFLRKYSAAWTDCIQSGLKLPDEIAVYQLLAKLDQHFDAWVTAKRQLLRNNENIKLHDLINQLIDENKRNNLQSNAQINLIKRQGKFGQSSTSTRHPVCECCKRHHPGGPDQCFDLHPELC